MMRGSEDQIRTTRGRATAELHAVMAIGQRREAFRLQMPLVPIGVINRLLDPLQVLVRGAMRDLDERVARQAYPVPFWIKGAP